ncbi:MAG TPA: hypothetical protein VKH35_17730 [Thermoanaerobaculia bacterium]|nr:hypothetical protein [Thermoanaerobaculia bacterium]
MNRQSLFAAVMALFLVSVGAAAAQLPRQDEQRRENARITRDGTIRSMTHERGGYRVQLDRADDVFWVPESAVRDHESDFKVGMSIHFGGIFRGGLVSVDLVQWPEAHRFDDSRYRDTISGVVERVNLRRGTLVVRDLSSGRRINVDIGSIRDRRGFDPGDLHRGDRVRLTGMLTRSGFVAYRIEPMRGRRN